MVSPILAASLTWSEAQPLGNVNHAWGKAALSTTGQVILVSGSSGQVALSTDRGTSWTVQNVKGDLTNSTWNALAVSANGQKLLAAAYGLRVYISNDGGTT